MRILAALLVVVAAMLTVATHTSSSDNAGANTGATSQTAAMRVYRDPVTGEFTTPPPSVQRGAGPAAPQPPPIVLEPNPNGGVKAYLGEAYEHTMRVSKDASGKLTFDCERDGAADRN